MKVAIMQPYFLPYIGYFQLINAVETFVIYDNIKYTKKGWINRNRILVNGTDQFISLPLKKDSDYFNINQRYISESWENEREKNLNKIRESYKNAPFFKQNIEIIEEILTNKNFNLFEFLHYSLVEICLYLNIRTNIVISSTINIDHSLKATDKVIEICKLLEATCYINAIGGQELYSKEKFAEKGLILNFIKSTPITYPQYKNQFVPWLSIIDVMMFNSKERITEMLNQYELV